MSALPGYFRHQLVPPLRGRHLPRCQDNDRALDLGMPEQKLDGPEIARPPVDQRRFCPSQRVGSEQPGIQPDASNPLGHKAGILAGRNVAVGTTTAGEQELPGPFVGGP